MTLTAPADKKRSFNISRPWSIVFKSESRAGLIWISVWQTDHSLEPSFQDILPRIFIPKAAGVEGVGPVLHLRNNAPTTKKPRAILARLRDVRSLTPSAQCTTFLPRYGQLGGSGLGCDLRAYRLVQRFEGKKRRPGLAKCIVAVLIRPDVGQAGDIDRWYRDEYLASVAERPMFVRCTRYESIPDVSEHDSHTPTSLLALHEFTDSQALLDFAIRHGDIVPETPWARQIFAQAKSVERTIWEVVESRHGHATNKTL